MKFEDIVNLWSDKIAIDLSGRGLAFTAHSAAISVDHFNRRFILEVSDLNLTITSVQNNLNKENFKLAALLHELGHFIDFQRFKTWNEQTAYIQKAFSSQPLRLQLEIDAWKNALELSIQYNIDSNIIFDNMRYALGSYRMKPKRVQMIINGMKKRSESLKKVA